MPYEPLTEDQVRNQRRANAETEQRQWSETKKRSRRLLRERKQLCKDLYLGKEVRFSYGPPSYREGSPVRTASVEHESRGKVTDVRIRDGEIEYVLDTKPQGIKRGRLMTWEVISDGQD